MSDSRLEKFIYAICSMDVSDLPVPLSRIEKLWNCLLTGETPDFEPLSRNEKYLMAMLDRYDISNLPAPMSRGEKLLYKIAVGETDLSDVPGYLSRYEELLKYLIENGGISGGDFEYVLYTLNQSLNTLYLTAEKPVKSAILKGDTLVNICKPFEFDIQTTGSGVRHLKDNFNMFNIPLDENKKYSIWVEIDINEIGTFSISHTGTLANLVFDPITNLTLTSGSVVAYPCVKRKNSNNTNLSIGAMAESAEGRLKGRIMVFEGDVRGLELSYFEGMQSVKMPVLKTTGKNLFDAELEQGSLNSNNGSYITTNTAIRTKDFIELSPNKTFSVSKTLGAKSFTILIYNNEKKFVRSIWDQTFTLKENERYIKITDGENNLENLYQIEEGSNITPYEPYKSNILTVNEDIELRGIGEVKDELDCLTGEVTQRIGEIVLDGSENWKLITHNNLNLKRYSLDGITFPFNNYQEISNHFRTGKSFWNVDETGLYIGANGKLIITFESTLDNRYNYTLNEFKNYLSENPIKLQYSTEESVKTVDLSVVDQDNQPTQLGTFENLTHVSLEAEGLIPEVEMEVATNLLEDTVFNLTNAFNMLYPTAEKPVKSAILSGNTLVNLCDKTKSVFSADGNKNLWQNALFNTNPTQLTVINHTDKVINFTAHNRTTDNWVSTNRVEANSKSLVNCGTNNYLKDLYGAYSDGWSNTEEDINILKDGVLILEGDHTQEDIPYFEGIQSVKMPVLTTTGKNLFNKNNIIVDGYIISNGKLVYQTGDNRNATDYIEVESNCSYTISGIKNSAINGAKTHQYIGMYDKNKTYISTVAIYCPRDKETITTAENTKYIRLSVRNDDINRLQIEKGTTPTTYEPHKSNILTVNEDVELRGIGDVRDELNCLTGEVTERIGEVVLNGSEKWVFNRTTTDYSIWQSDMTNPALNTIQRKNNVLCDKYIVEDFSGFNDKNYEFISISGGSSNTLYLKLVTAKASTVTELKTYLNSNPFTVQYQLATNTVKTVDLTTVDQDGNVTTLKTFDDTTHVLLNSEGLIPTAVLTVRTKIPSGSSTSLLMDNISTEQQQLNTMVDEQSENVDATMFATTEIFEEIL